MIVVPRYNKFWENKITLRGGFGLVNKFENEKILNYDLTMDCAEGYTC